MATEKRLVDANELMEHLEQCIATNRGLFRYVCVAIKCFVEQMTTVDAVEVVRCKDCKYHKPLTDYRGSTLHVCGRRKLNVEMHEEGFCYRGEKANA